MLQSISYNKVEGSTPPVLAGWPTTHLTYRLISFWSPLGSSQPGIASQPVSWPRTVVPCLLLHTPPRCTLRSSRSRHIMIFVKRDLTLSHDFADFTSPMMRLVHLPFTEVLHCCCHSVSRFLLQPPCWSPERCSSFLLPAALGGACWKPQRLRHVTCFSSR